MGMVPKICHSHSFKGWAHPLNCFTDKRMFPANLGYSASELAAFKWRDPDPKKAEGVYYEWKWTGPAANRTQDDWTKPLKIAVVMRDKATQHHAICKWEFNIRNQYCRKANVATTKVEKDYVRTRSSASAGSYLAREKRYLRGQERRYGTGTCNTDKLVVRSDPLTKALDETSSVSRPSIWKGSRYDQPYGLNFAYNGHTNPLGFYGHSEKKMFTSNYQTSLHGNKIGEGGPITRVFNDPKLGL